MVRISNVEFSKAAISLLLCGPLWGLWKYFSVIVKNEFIHEDLLGRGDLRRYFLGRLFQLERTAEGNANFNNSDMVERLMRESLKLAERILRNWFGDHHYELSIFEGKSHPKIVCYHDSNDHNVPRSVTYREENPDYYRQEGYEVIKLLDNPVTKVVVIPDTEQSKYKHANMEQQKFLRSTALCIVDIQKPSALVITTSQANAFKQWNNNANELFQSVVSAIKAEYALQRAIEHICHTSGS